VNVELELYKLAVEMADRVSARRATANTFFLTVNTGLAALLGGKELRWYVAVAGILFALTWFLLLRSYRRLNAAKFDVILAIEQGFSIRPYTDEWQILKPKTPGDKRRRKYLELGQVERIVPLVFIAIYTAELIRQAT
jgi:hypothetical protein